jgi:hypothetical protein
MMISLTEGNAPVEIDYAEILSLSGQKLFEVPLKKKEGERDVYMADAFIPPDDFFYVAVSEILLSEI